MITITDFIIAGFAMSICAAVIVGVLVYCILKKKHDEDINWLFNIICNNKTEVNRFYEEYKDHEYNCHSCYERFKKED
jgi:hypothetical protein